MAKKPEPPKPTTWTIYKIAKKQVWLGTVEAPDEATAIEKAAEFKIRPPSCTRCRAAARSTATLDAVLHNAHLL